MTVDGPPASGSMPYAQAPSLIGEVLDGRYRIVRKLGEGGMGEVFAADHVHIEKRFAVKLLRPEIVSNAEAVQRFRQEARSASSIGHRNIIAIEDFGQLPDGRIYMCMELLNGAALNDLIQTPISFDRLLNILIQTGHGLAAAHAKGIIHRDMKPENIFVTVAPNGEDVPKLLDFGIAKVAGNDGQNNLTRTGTIFGTPFYMAPEQALGNAVDARTDVYAMGVIMYEVFAGSLPFQGESFMGILTQHITTEPEPVAQRAAKAGRQLPGGLAEIIARCMQKNPGQRFGTMDELVNALIPIYRGIAGPGMSTYMEAFPVSAAYSVPHSPRTGPVQVPYPPTGAVPVPQPPSSGPHGQPMHGHGQPMISGQSPSVAPGSGIYPARPAGGSKMGLIIALIAVLVVGGGITAFALMNGGKSDNKEVIGSGSGDSKGSDGSGSAIAAAPDAGTAEPVDAAEVAAVDAAIDAAEVAAVDAAPPPADAPEVVATVEVLIRSKYHSSFEVWEGSKRLFEGANNLTVTPGEPRIITIKARGYLDQTFTVNAEDGRKFEFRLKRIQSGSGSAPPPPTVNCKDKVVDSSNPACIRQYCLTHGSDSRCDL